VASGRPHGPPSDNFNERAVMAPSFSLSVRLILDECASRRPIQFSKNRRRPGTGPAGRSTAESVRRGTVLDYHSAWACQQLFSRRRGRDHPNDPALADLQDERAGVGGEPDRPIANPLAVDPHAALLDEPRRGAVRAGSARR